MGEELFDGVVHEIGVSNVHQSSDGDGGEVEEFIEEKRMLGCDGGEEGGEWDGGGMGEGGSRWRSVVMCSDGLDECGCIGRGWVGKRSEPESVADMGVREWMGDGAWGS